MDEKELELLEDEDQIVVMSDEEGNEYYYREEMVIPLGDKNFALLIPIGECECDNEQCVCHESEDEDPDVYIARIDFDENGEEVYLDPTEEEFEAVRNAYEEMVAASEE